MVCIRVFIALEIIVPSHICLNQRLSHGISHGTNHGLNHNRSHSLHHGIYHDFYQGSTKVLSRSLSLSQLQSLHGLYQDLTGIKNEF
jgi:hypothetical protein